MNIVKKMKKIIFGENTMETNETMTNQENEHDIELNTITQDDLKLTYSKNEDIVYDNFEKKDLFMMLFDRFKEKYNKQDLIDVFKNKKELALVNVKRKKYKPKNSYGKFAFNNSEDIKLFLKRAYTYNRTFYMYSVISVNWGLRRSDVLKLTYAEINKFITSCESRLENVSNPFVMKKDKKTGNDNIKYFTVELLTVVKEYMNDLRNGVICKIDEIDFENEETPFLINKNGKPFDEAAVTRGFRYLNKTYYGNIKGLESHALRRSYASTNTKKGKSMGAISKELGHYSERQTQVYSLIDAEQKRELTLNIV